MFYNICRTPGTVAIAGVYSMWFELNNDICLNQIKYKKQIVHISNLIFTFQRSIELASNISSLFNTNWTSYAPYFTFLLHYVLRL